MSHAWGLNTQSEYCRRKSNSLSSNSAVAAAACTANFITVIDALQLNMRAKDELVPLLTNVVTSLGRVEGLPADFEGKVSSCCIYIYICIHKSKLLIISHMFLSVEDQRLAVQILDSCSSSRNWGRGSETTCLRT